MRRFGWAAHLWPGLADLWQRGAWSGLLLATFFTILLNIVVVTSLVWTQWLSPTLQHGTRAVLLFTWVGGVWWSVRNSRRERLTAFPSGQDLFALAQSQYLGGNWFEAEVAITRLLRANGRDVDAHLMLATLMRHTDRLAEARQQLRRLQLLEGSRKWAMEIGRELRRIDEAEAERQNLEAEEAVTADGAQPEEVRQEDLPESRAA